MKNKVIVIFFLAFILFAMSGYVTWQKDGVFTSLGKGKIEAAFNNIREKNSFIEINGASQRLMDKRKIDDVDALNSVVKLNNGYLISAGSFDASFDAPGLFGKADKIIELKGYLEKSDIDFLYVQIPHKISSYGNCLPRGLTYEGNKAGDVFLNRLSSAGVDCIDLREEMKKDGIDHFNAFYITDHHWTTEAGFWAFGNVGRYLNKNYGFDINEKYFDGKNYSFKTEEKAFLGSFGRRVGRLYGGIDDFTYLLPEFETDLNVSVPSKSIEKTGSFKDAFFDESYLDKKDLYDSNIYTIYTKDYPLQKIENKLDGTKKVLLLRDSYSCVFSPFLSLGCSRLDIIDLRYYTETTLKEYIDKTQPDMVLFAYFLGMLDSNSDVMFQFGLAS